MLPEPCAFDARRRIATMIAHCITFRRLAAAFGLLVSALGSCLAGEPAVVRIAVLAFQGSEYSTADWAHLADRLNETVPNHRFELLHVDLPGLRDAVARRQVDFALTNGGQYVMPEAEFGVSRILTASRADVPSPDRALGSAIIVRSDRTDIRNLAQLKHRPIAAVAPDAFGGYLIAAREFARSGMPLDRDAAQVRFVGLPMQRIVEAVIRGDADAGIVRSCLLESLVDKGIVHAGELKVAGAILHDGFPCAVSTPLYPDWPLAKARHTDLKLAKDVATSLLSMPETREGLTWAVPADYQAVHELYRELQTGPYAYLRESTLRAIARKYWPYLLLVVIGMTAFIIHAMRVEHLVKLRTRELSEALAARHAAEAGMRNQQEQAEHLSRLSILGELAGTLAHELNQPLTTIATYAQSLQRRITADNVDMVAFAEASGEITAQAERAAGMIQRIRAFARKRASVREERELETLVREAVALFSGMMPTVPQVSIVCAIPTHSRVHADALQVQQVLLNLLKNAADATEHLPAERRGITIRMERLDGWLRVSVMDRGHGLGPELRTRLFEPFFTTKHNGLGLGLSICKSIVEAHGGRLTAHPRDDGPGLSFSFTLPAHAPA